MIKIKFSYVVLLLALFLIMLTSMRQVAKQVAIISEGTGIMDLNFYNSKEFIMQTLQELGQKGRDFYLTKFFIVDFFYPITYAAFYGFTILYVLEKLENHSKTIKLLALIPVCGMCFDWLENVSISSLLTTFPNDSTLLYLMATISTILKFSFVYLAVVTIIILVVLVIIKRKNI
ncbi:MAG: hypothetical protein KIC94_07270 [Clostridiales bacterium]|nr:hypothetical protein [Clostridiales bacterium]